MGKGNVPLAVRPFYFGTNLITLNKKGGGGARLIAVGNTLCRLVAKCFSSQVLDKVSAYLLPLQLVMESQEELRQLYTLLGVSCSSLMSLRVSLSLTFKIPSTP